MIRTDELVRRVGAGEKTAEIATSVGGCPKLLARRIAHARRKGKLPTRAENKTIEERILPLAKKGKSSSEIAETLGLNKKSVQVKMSELRTRGVLPPFRHVPVNDAVSSDVLALSSQAFEPHEIAERLGVHKRTVYAVKQSLRSAGKLAPHAPAVALAPVAPHAAVAPVDVAAIEPLVIEALPFGRLMPAAEREPRTDGLVDLLDLTDKTCRWPVGDPTLPGFGFCGGEVSPGCKPYCATHGLRAYASPAGGEGVAA